MTPVIAGDGAGATRRLQSDPGATATFMPGGHTPKAGDWFRNPDMANSLRVIGKDGPAAIYGGELGQKIVARIKELGGFVTLEDLKKNEPTWVTPISTMFKGYRVWELPPNNQGIAVLEMLRILDTYDLKSMGANTAPSLHLIEAKKLAYADLVRYDGDADHLTIPPGQILSDPFTPERRSHRRAQKRRRTSNRGRGARRVQNDLSHRRRQRRQHGVVHQQLVRRGSGDRRAGHGFALQNRGAGFTMEPNLRTRWRRASVPFHTLIPAFVTKPDRLHRLDGTGDSRT